jgi:Na+-transporting NADH:ubiquinone oxidoreductase subunit A
VAVHRIKKGLDLPISGAPAQSIHDGAAITRVALLGDDYHGLRARLHVEEGATVRRGQLLFEDRTAPGVRYTAPGAGRVAAINRGRRRALQSVVIQLSPNERSGQAADAEHADFESYRRGEGGALGADEVRALLVESGLWTALRTRPFSRVPAPDATPDAIFVNAMDTEPLAASPEVVIAERRADFERGLRLVSKLTAGTTYLCVAADSELARGVDAPVAVEEFRGPHPAGTAGLHIHLLAPVSRARTVWTLGYQDAIAVGALFATGRLPVERVIALAGPAVRRPRLLRSRLGASTEEHARGELAEGEVRLISGSVLSGKKAMGPVFGFLSRHHLQVSALAEGRQREFMGWAAPGRRRFSSLPVFVSRLLRPASYDFTTSTHGSQRAIVPIGMYERVMPLDILPTFLLRALVVGDIEQAEKLGALELDEEDLALCTFVDPGKGEFGPLLRRNLERIEREG